MDYYSKYLDNKIKFEKLRWEYDKLLEAYNDLRVDNKALQVELDLLVRDTW